MDLKRLARLSAVLCASSCLSGVAYAQTISVPTAPTPPIRTFIDERGVDLISGSFTMAEPLLSIGQSSVGLSRVRQANALSDNYEGKITADGATYTVTAGASAETFTYSGGAFTSKQSSGSTLTLASGVYTYTLRDGSVIQYPTSLAGTGNSATQPLARMSTITTPNGLVTTVNYKSATVAYNTNTQAGTIQLKFYRIQSVTNTAGYQLKYNYAQNSMSTINDVNGWLIPNGFQGINNAVDYCAPTADTCSLTQTWPSVTISGNAVTDALNRTTTYNLTTAANGTSTITRPSGAVITIVNDASGRVASWSNGTGTWTYSYSDSGTGRTTTATDPLGHVRILNADLSLLTVSMEWDALYHLRYYDYDSAGRMTKAYSPEGDYIGYVYDSRGNVTQTTFTPKTNSGQTAITVTAGYDATCANAKTCNQPNWTKDALGAQTDYTYDATHGGVLTVTAPAGADGVRPQKRNSYLPQYAWYKNATGAVVQAPTAVQELITASACATGASCAGAATEVKKTYAYGASGVANNLLPTTIGAGSGDGALWASTSLTYDGVGNLLTVDGPLAGTADTTRYRYDAARQVIGVVGPDPDGGNALKHRAVRYTYDADGRTTIVARGMVNSQSDSDWAAINVAQLSLAKYDALGRLILTALDAGGAIQSATQYSYDAANRLTCSAVRMNPAVFGTWPNFSTLPSSACSLGTEGADGPDRISYTVYDAADQVLEVYSGWGTSAPIREAKYSYSNNGQVQTVTDASNNLTTLIYDGYDRPQATYFPSASVGGLASNTSDYTLLSYDAAGRVTQQRLRDGQVINYGYDANGRLTSKDRPSTWADTTYAYDNLGRLTSTSYPGYVLGLTYDALGRVTAQSAPQGTMSYQYDLAGNRTRVTWPDAFYVSYEYLTTGEMYVARENGATSGAGVLATYTYDDLGRRTGLWRGNGVVTAYGYDAASRLNGLIHDLPGTAQDQTYAYAYNAAGQITSRSATNDAYRHLGAATTSKTYGVNGLNQMTTAGGATLGYDGRGNLASDGSTAFGYDPENRLVYTDAGTALTYDPAGRIYYAVGGGTTTQFIYDGANLSAELNAGGTLLRRYVPGPGMDEPIAWYEGSGTSDRRWYAADERGSVVGVLNGSGAAQAINTYDEYGLPGAGNLGRYQYTGQTWLPEAGVYNYKARTYSPSLGRFMQTDPIGYADGLNWYAYVGNDPINGADPWGLQEDKKKPPCTPGRQGGCSEVTPLSGVTVTGAKRGTTGVVSGNSVGRPGAREGSGGTPSAEYIAQKRQACEAALAYANQHPLSGAAGAFNPTTSTLKQALKQSQSTEVFDVAVSIIAGGRSVGGAGYTLAAKAGYTNAILADVLGGWGTVISTIITIDAELDKKYQDALQEAIKRRIRAEEICDM